VLVDVRSFDETAGNADAATDTAEREQEINAGETVPLSEVMAEFRSRRSKRVEAKNGEAKGPIENER